MASELVVSPWRAKFESIVVAAKKELRIAAPYYTEDTIRYILTHTGKQVKKYFLFALSE